MAFSPQNLALVRNTGKAPRFWSYSTPDPVATIDAGDYFSDAAALLQVGDFIFVKAGNPDDSASPIYVVVSDDPGFVQLFKKTV